MKRQTGGPHRDPRHGGDEQGLVVRVTFEPSYTAATCIVQAYEQVAPLIQRTPHAAHRTSRTSMRQTLVHPTASLLPRLRREEAGQ